MKLYEPAASRLWTIELGTVPSAFKVTVSVEAGWPLPLALVKNSYVTVPGGANHGGAPGRLPGGGVQDSGRHAGAARLDGQRLDGTQGTGIVAVTAVDGNEAV